MNGRIAGLLLGGVLALDAGMARADLAADVQARLYAADTAGAAARAQAALQAGDSVATAHMALGVARFLGTVETLMQGLHRHGLHNTYQGAASLGLMPLVRLPVPVNPAPQPVTYARLRTMLEDFSAGMARAEAHLARVGDAQAALPLDMKRVAVRITPDAAGRVPVLALLSAVAGGPVVLPDGPLTIAFDTADATWLRAYTHVLMALSDFLLAHDWEDAYQASFHGLFPESFTPDTALRTLRSTLAEKVAQARTTLPPEPDCDWSEGGCAEKRTEYAQQFEARVGWVERALQYDGIADMAAFLHLLRWPVVDEPRMASALAHMQQMIVLSRGMWTQIAAETDDDREWIPGTHQTGAMALGDRPLITPQIVDGWLAFLDETEAILQGRKLLPHWRFARGINLRRFFMEPRTFDPVLMVQGYGVLPYLEEGPISNSQTWEQIIDVFDGGFFAYAIWIN